MTNPADITLDKMWRFCHDRASRNDTMQDLLLRDGCAGILEALGRLVDGSARDQVLNNRLKEIKREETVNRGSEVRSSVVSNGDG